MDYSDTTMVITCDNPLAMEVSTNQCTKSKHFLSCHSYFSAALLTIALFFKRSCQSTYTISSQRLSAKPVPSCTSSEVHHGSHKAAGCLYGIRD